MKESGLTEAQKTGMSHARPSERSFDVPIGEATKALLKVVKNKQRKAILRAETETTVTSVNVKDIVNVLEHRQPRLVAQAAACQKVTTGYAVAPEVKDRAWRKNWRRRQYWVRYARGKETKPLEMVRSW